MGSKGGATTSSTMKPPPEVMAAYKDVLSKAKGLADKPYEQYGGELVPEMNQGQLQALGAMGQDYNISQPYYQIAGQQMQSAMQGYNPENFASGVNAYMSPYLNTAMQSTSNQLQNMNAQQWAKMQGNAISSGAFGGDRAGIGLSELANQQNLASGQVLGQMANQGYQNASSNYLNSLQNRMSGAQNYGQMGGMAQASALQGDQALMSGSAIPYAIQQAKDASDYQLFSQRQAYPFQTLGFYGNLATGLGGNMGGTSTTTGPGPNSFSQILGLGTTLLGLSDERTKENVKHVGKTFDGQPIYKFNYKGNDEPRMGLMAQDVEKKHPDAVHDIGGLKMVDYDKATRDSASRGHFAYGGSSSEGGVVGHNSARMGFKTYGFVPYVDDPLMALMAQHSPVDLGSIVPDSEKLASAKNKIPEAPEYKEPPALDTKGMSGFIDAYKKYSNPYSNLGSDKAAAQFAKDTAGIDKISAMDFSDPSMYADPSEEKGFLDSLKGLFGYSEGGVIARHHREDGGGLNQNQIALGQQLSSPLTPPVNNPSTFYAQPWPITPDPFKDLGTDKKDNSDGHDGHHNQGGNRGQDHHDENSTTTTYTPNYRNDIQARGSQNDQQNAQNVNWKPYATFAYGGDVSPPQAPDGSGSNLTGNHPDLAKILAMQLKMQQQEQPQQKQQEMKRSPFASFAPGGVAPLPPLPDPNTVPMSPDFVAPDVVPLPPTQRYKIEPKSMADMPISYQKLIKSIYGPESGGKYNIMQGGQETFDTSGSHPARIGKGGTSTAAGAGQFVKGTWNEVTGGAPMKPEYQDAATMALASKVFKAKTGMDLGDYLEKRGGPDKNVFRTLGNTWTGLRGHSPDTALAKYNPESDYPPLRGSPVSGDQNDEMKTLMANRGKPAPTSSDQSIFGRLFEPDATNKNRSLLERVYGDEISPEARSAVIAAGLGMMSARSPWALTNIGEGGTKGLETYYNAVKNKYEREKTAAETQKIGQEAGKIGMETVEIRGKMFTRQWVPGIGFIMFDQANPSVIQRITDAQLKPMPGVDPSFLPNAPKAPDAPDATKPNVSTGDTNTQPPATTPPKKEEEPKSDLDWKAITTVPDDYVPPDQYNITLNEEAKQREADVGKQQVEKARNAQTAAFSQLYRLEEMDKQFANLPPTGLLSAGTYAPELVDLAKGVNKFLGVIGGTSVFDTNAIAAAESLQKDTFRLGAEVTQAMGKEPGFIVQQAVAANPSISNTPIAYRRIVAGLREAAQYAKDRAEFLNSFYGRWGHTNRAEELFQKLNPPEKYANRAILSTVDKRIWSDLKKYGPQQMKEKIDKIYGSGVTDLMMGY